MSYTVPPTMRVVEITAFGPAERLVIGERSVPVPSSQEVLPNVLVTVGRDRLPQGFVPEELDYSVGRALRRVYEKPGGTVQELYLHPSD